MKRLTVPEVVVVGHTDTLGDAGANVALGLKRAMTVKSVLVDAGIAPPLIDGGLSWRSRPPGQDARQHGRAAQSPRRNFGEVAAPCRGRVVPRVGVSSSSAARCPSSSRRCSCCTGRRSSDGWIDSTYDLLLRSARATPPAAGVVIVDVDERSLTTVGQWPWRRDVVGRLISAVEGRGRGGHRPRRHLRGIRSVRAGLQGQPGCRLGHDT